MRPSCPGSGGGPARGIARDAEHGSRRRRQGCGIGLHPRSPATPGRRGRRPRRWAATSEATPRGGRRGASRAASERGGRAEPPRGGPRRTDGAGPAATPTRPRPGIVVIVGVDADGVEDVLTLQSAAADPGAATGGLLRKPSPCWGHRYDFASAGDELHSHRAAPGPERPEGGGHPRDRRLAPGPPAPQDGDASGGGGTPGPRSRERGAQGALRLPAPPANPGRGNPSGARPEPRPRRPTHLDPRPSSCRRKAQTYPGPARVGESGPGRACRASLRLLRTNVCSKPKVRRVWLRES